MIPARVSEIEPQTAELIFGTIFKDLQQINSSIRQRNSLMFWDFFDNKDVDLSSKHGDFVCNQPLLWKTLQHNIA